MKRTKNRVGKRIASDDIQINFVRTPIVRNVTAAAAAAKNVQKEFGNDDNVLVLPYYYVIMSMYLNMFC